MNEVKKFCADCKTTKTPLWRTGPDGPRSLCNACGIRYRKRKMADERPNPEMKREKASSSSSNSYLIGESLNVRFSVLGKQMIVQTSSSSSQLKKHRNKKKLGEVEQAAALLMSLSCGSVFA